MSQSNATQERGAQKKPQRPSNLRPTRFDDKPLWNHVKVTTVPAGGGGNRTWICNYCKKKVTGSYSKVKAHLLKLPGHGVECCKGITDETHQALKRDYDQAERKKFIDEQNEKNRAEYVGLPTGSDLEQNKRNKRGALGPLEKAFDMTIRDQANKEAARMFYASALPFNFAKSPYFRQYSRTLANNNLAGYTPPTYNRLRTTLLAQEKSHINGKLQPIKDTWRKKGVSIVSDGWGDRQKRPLINIMGAAAGGAMFLKAIDASGNIKDGEYVAGLFLEAVNEIGARNVVQIVTDNAGNYKSAGAIIEGRYPYIFWTPCVVHSLNLALKSICDPTEKSPQYVHCKWIAELVNEVQDIRNFIVNHGIALHIFNKYSKLALLRVADTRFASSIIMAKRLREVKSALETMVMDSEWRIYREGNNESKAAEVKKCIVDDWWWDKVDYLISFTEPIVNMIRIADTDTPVLHLIYDMWDTMIEDVKKIIFEHEHLDLISGHSEFFDALHHILESRWNKSNTPLHCMAHSLVPKYYCEAWLQGGSDGVARIAPHEDREVSMNRSKCFERLFLNPTDLKNVYAEFGLFSSGSEHFSQPYVIEARMYEEPISWWANHGSSIPLLQSLAFRLLSQPASSSCCERNWGTYSLIHSVKRNKLATSRAENLVFVHYNLRLLSRKEDDYKDGPSKYWDLSGDRSDFDAQTSMEFADLSLDEPELEGVIFDDEDKI